ncbi:MAG: ArsC/Spx/MgsR family protein [Myxococcota bacterium]|nr:ArsC/Spx/MgsR family protein [Myxococcota bacterium]
MKGRIYVLGSCNTCTRILGGLPQGALEVREFRSAPITEAELDEMIELAGSAGALFSKRARKYRELGLHEQAPSEQQMRALILEHDTFLKRPVAIVEGESGAQIFVGNAKKNVSALIAALS